METEFLLKFLVSYRASGPPSSQPDELVGPRAGGARGFQAKLDHFKEIEARWCGEHGAQALSHVMLAVIDEKWKDHSTTWTS